MRKRAIPKKPVNIRLEEGVHKALKILAVRLGTTVSDLMNEAAIRLLEEYNQPIEGGLFSQQEKEK